MVFKRAKRECSVDGCEKQVKARGWCANHWFRYDSVGFCSGHAHSFRRYGDPLKARRGIQGNGWMSNGYRMIGDVREHRLVVERILKCALPRKAVIHHVDEDRSNNVPTNLVVCPSNAYHRLLHRRMAARDASGNPNFRKCPYCKAYDDPANMRQEKSGRCVHRICANAATRASPSYIRQRKRA